MPRFWFALSALLALAGPAAADCDARQTKVVVTPEGPRTPALLDRHEKLSSEAKFKDTDVLLIGDSLASKWPETLILKAFGAKSAVNLGVPGDRIQNVIWRLDNSRLDTMSPKLVVLLAGTNNLKYVQQPPCAIASGTRIILRKIRETWPYVKIVAIETPPRFERPDPAFDVRRTEYNRLLRGAVATTPDARTVNVDAALACDGATESCPLYAKDGVHLTGRGYVAMGDAISAALAQKAP